ncbi:MAG: GDSL-type esterase/lipase family protein [Eubacteriales bacterium]|nr:GDSL-type esterase/lipase family protein [Eubacteriales bacterium]
MRKITSGSKLFIIIIVGSLSVATVAAAWLIKDSLNEAGESLIKESEQKMIEADVDTISVDTDGNIVTSDPENFNLMGRFFLKEKDGVSFHTSVWSGAEIEFGFTGTQAWCYLYGEEEISDLKGVYAGVYIDNSDEPYQIICVTEPDWYKVADDIENKEHTVRIVKHSEAFGGRLGFSEIRVTAPGKINKAPPVKEFKLEIIGDSITAGYGNMADSAHDPFRINQENIYLTYGAILARRMEARAHYLAWSGIGVLQNNDGRQINTMPKIYEITAPGVNRDRWDFSSYVPDMIIVNLGTNDMASNADPEKFKNAYIGFIGLIRDKNPEALIFCTMGVMGVRLVPAMEEAVEDIRTKGDNKVFSIPLHQQQGSDGYGADGHPSLVTHAKMAEYLFDEISRIRGTYEQK